jgi:hypothetical protein
MQRLLRYIAAAFTTKTEEGPGMAKAFIGNLECQVTVDKDLGDSWAVAVIPPPPSRRGERTLPPLVIKLQGEDKEKITKGALELFQQRGQIDRFEI